jgi:phosphoheptose isomerase
MHMKEVWKEADILWTGYPELTVCKDDILSAFALLQTCHDGGGLIMTCGNGGSAADAGHIAGELMKAFKRQRPLTDKQRQALCAAFPLEGHTLAGQLQQAIPALSLVGQTALLTACANDVSPDMIYAQQVFGYGKAGDVLIALSTSGNSVNVVNACKVAKAFEVKTIGMTGASQSMLSAVCDVCIRVPAQATYRVQEYHLPVYHALCAMLEAYSLVKGGVS